MRDNLPQAPIAEARPQPVVSPQGVRIDPYFWLRDDLRLDPRVLGYLRAENSYTEAVRKSFHGLEGHLYAEMVARIPPDDVTVPVLKRGYWYYARFTGGSEYPLYARRRAASDAPEELLLDVNALASGKEFFNVGAHEVSPDNRLLAYTEDTVGRRQFTLRFKDLVSGAALPDAVENVEAEVAWAGDSRSILYVEKDPVTLLGFRVRRHVLGSTGEDAVVWEQSDTSFYTSVIESRSGRFLYIVTESTVSSEWWFADASDPALGFKVILPRERDHEYQVDDLGSRFVIRTNWQAPNFRIMDVLIAACGDRTQWREVVPGREDVYIHEFAAFGDYLAIGERSGGLRRITVRPWSDVKAERRLEFDEPAYTALLDINPSPDTTELRYTYSSLTTPTSTFSYDMRTGERTLLKRDPLPKPFDPANYVSEYLHAPARDGAQIPVSVVYRKGTPLDGTAPLYQYAYGSYGISTDPEFSRSRLSLLDRGFVIALAHVRGGQELGRSWYDDGRLLNKINTFNDFIDVTAYLVKQKYAAPDRIVAHGRSAGGLLMGAIANAAPASYRVILADVPFVDVVTSMLDETLPLTAEEYDQWGDPRQRVYYDYMLSYSPYDQVKPQDYPAMLVTAGLWDSQVQYFEPAKWVAKLRATRTDHNPLLLWTNMEAGHGGQSGRFRRLHETAMLYAFAMHQLGIRD